MKIKIDERRCQGFGMCALAAPELFKVGEKPMSEIVGGWKSYTATKANKILGIRGAFWAADYWDTFMRDSNHEARTCRYIENNVTKARLVVDPKKWARSSARLRDEYGQLRL